MRGVIEQIYDNTSKDGKPYKVIVINGERYGVWDTKLFPVCIIGSVVEFQITQKGEYKNITEMQIAGDMPPQKIKPRETTMIKMNALNNSVNLLKIMSDLKILVPQEATPERAMQIADRFISYIGGEE